MNDQDKQQLEQLLKQSAPILKQIEERGIVPPERGRKALHEVLDRVFPVVKELAAKEMEALLLKILSEQSLTGYDIASRLEKASIKLKEGGEGVLYGLLAKLESKGCVRGEWRDVGDKMIKIYRTTEKGDGMLRSVKVEAAQLNRWSELVLSLS